MTPNLVADLSHHNLVNLHVLKNNGVKAILHKATQGMAGYPDPMYNIRHDKCRTLGLMFGSYHFGTGQGTGKEQAENFLYDIGWGTHNPVNGPMVLDFETNTLGPSMTTDQAVEFLHTVQEKTGEWPGIYCNLSTAKLFLEKGPQTIPGNFWLWLAWYPDVKSILEKWPLTPKPGVPAYSDVNPSAIVQWPAGLKLWQYSDGSARFHPEKYLENIDADAFNGTPTELETWWKGFST